MTNNNHRIKIPWSQTPDGSWTIAEKQTEIDRMFDKANSAVLETLAIIKPILKAGGGAKKEDRENNLKPMIFKNLMERLDRLDRDEMHMLITTLLGDKIMQDVEANPWGGGTPDLLSGK